MTLLPLVWSGGMGWDGGLVAWFAVGSRFLAEEVLPQIGNRAEWWAGAAVSLLSFVPRSIGNGRCENEGWLGTCGKVKKKSRIEKDRSGIALIYPQK